MKPITIADLHHVLASLDWPMELIVNQHDYLELSLRVNPGSFLADSSGFMCAGCIVRPKAPRPDRIDISDKSLNEDLE
jgi:hypothetical protein